VNLGTGMTPGEPVVRANIYYGAAVIGAIDIIKLIDFWICLRKIWQLASYRFAPEHVYMCIVRRQRCMNIKKFVFEDKI